MRKVAYFAGGCFWCITPIFINYGARKVTCGYCGGKEENPTYQQVKSQNTTHRETVLVEYDDQKLEYRRLVRIFLANIDPYDENGQFIDRGYSYTLAIFYQDEAEKEIAKEEIGLFEKKHQRKTFISLEPFKTFYPAEDYHQDYYLKNPELFEKELIDSGRKKKDAKETV